MLINYKQKIDNDLLYINFLYNKKRYLKLVLRENKFNTKLINEMKRDITFIENKIKYEESKISMH